MRLSYVLPLRWQSDENAAELTAYLSALGEYAEIILVDGSPEPLFSAHHHLWSSLCTHIRPDPELRFANGKVIGVHTGLRRASFEAVVIADDDVRYDVPSLNRMAKLLETCDLVRPQNYFDPTPWHALWDTARSLVNRAFGGDWPGTLGIRRTAFERVGGYDGDVLFENLELVRTIEASGGTVVTPLDLYVHRLPPETARFLGQRVRQAYDEFARPGLLAFWLGLLPATIALGAVTPVAPVAIAAAGVWVAELGRRRAQGLRYFPPAASLLAPLWMAERSLTVWLALGCRLLFGGMPYAGRVIAKAANSSAELSRRRGSRLLWLTLRQNRP